MSSIRISGNRKVQAAVISLLLIVVAADMFYVSRPLVSDAFPREPAVVSSTNLGTPDFIQFYSTAPDSIQYQNLLQGIGTLDCYERLHLRIRALPQFVDGVPYKGFIGNAYIAETNESVNFTHFSQNTMSLKLPQINSESTLVVNQNYYKGWIVVREGSSAKALSFNGLIATPVSPSDSGNEIIFRFTSPQFVIGSVISLFALVAAIFVLFKPGVAAAVVSPASGTLKRIEAWLFRQR